MMIKHLYVHVPFCNAYCAYCDFARTIYRNDLVKPYLEALAKEMEQISLDDEHYETIYIGGGTPSSLNCAELEELFILLEPYSKWVKEYTMEVNPESLTEEKIELMARYGINRVSIGLQSSDQRLLKLMNRQHSFDDFVKSVKELRAHSIHNISADLIYSLPTQTMDDLVSTLDDVLSLNLNHLSLYSLTIEENSTFGRLGYEALDSDGEADMYEYIEKRLIDAGYIHYEVANFAKEGYHSRHNMAYWRYDDFRALGPGGSSKIGNIRYTNTRVLKDYLVDVFKKDEYLQLNREDMMFENVMMSLRTIYGLDLKLFKRRYQKDALKVYEEAIHKNQAYLRLQDDCLICTERELLNEILLDFM